MIGTLIESQAHAPRRIGGSAVSIVAHASIVVLAVVATAARQLPSIHREPVGLLHILPPPASSQQQARTKPIGHPLTGAVPVMPTIQVPTITPTDIPAIDFSAPIPTTDFRISSTRTGDRCGDFCSRPNTVGADTSSAAWTGSEAMMQLREAPVPPRYPEGLRRAGIDGTVVIRFVVDTLGRVDRASIEVVSSTHSLFTAAVRETLDRLRFYPAMVAGRKVRAAAVMPFQFTLK